MSERRSFFLTGTDTGVGKTLVATALLLEAAGRGLRTLGVKPVSAGCELHAGRLRNADALSLQAASTVAPDYDQVNPFAFEPPIAPHIAAAAAGVQISAAAIVEHIERSARAEVDLMIVEGAGGWLVPLNESETLADVCSQLRMDVILVVGMKLGCINHALLTSNAIAQSGLRFSGWIANHIDEQMLVAEECFDTLQERLPGPCLGSIPALGDNASAADVVQHLRMDLAS